MSVTVIRSVEAPRLYRISEVCKLIGKSQASVYRLMNDPVHPLPWVTVGSSRRVPADLLIEWQQGLDGSR